MLKAMVTSMLAPPAFDRLSQARSKIDEILQSSGVPGASIGVIHQKSVVHTYNYGLSHVDGNIATTSNTVYGIGSITKSFIATSIAKLVDQKKISWDTRVRDIIPDFKHYDPVLTNMATITDLLAHRCGLSGLGALDLAFQGDGDMLLPKESLLQIVHDLPIASPFRSSWSYLVWGYAIAGIIIETITKKPLKDHMDEAIFQPLGMNSTSFSPSYFKPGVLSDAYTSLSNGSPFRLPKLQVFENTFFEASGGMYSSLSDMLIWANQMVELLHSQESPARKESKWISDKQAAMLFSNHAAMVNPSVSERSYGLGWVRTALPGVIGLIGDNCELWDVNESPLFGSSQNPELMIYHQGSTVGYQSFIAIFPRTESAIVVLTNSLSTSDAADWVGRLVSQALLFPDDPHDYVQLSKEATARSLALFDKMHQEIGAMRASNPGTSPRPLSSFVGEYALPSKLFSIYIKLDPKQQGQLLLQFQGLQDQTYELRHLSEDVFEWSLTYDESKKRGRYLIADTPFYLFKFHVDELGQPVSLSWVNDPSIVDNPAVLQRTERKVDGTEEESIQELGTSSSPAGMKYLSRHDYKCVALGNSDKREHSRGMVVSLLT